MSLFYIIELWRRRLRSYSFLPSAARFNRPERAFTSRRNYSAMRDVLVILPPSLPAQGLQNRTSDDSGQFISEPTRQVIMFNSIEGASGQEIMHEA